MMDFSFGRAGRHSFQLQSRQATDTKDGGTYNIGNAAYIRDYAGDPYQSSIGIALRQDFVDSNTRAAQERVDAESAAAKAAAKVDKSNSSSTD